MPGEREKVTEMGKWVEITDFHNFGLPLWLVSSICATFFLPDRRFRVIPAHFRIKFLSGHVDLAVACVIFSTA